MSSRSSRIANLSKGVDALAASTNRLPMCCTVYRADAERPHKTLVYSTGVWEVDLYLDELVDVDRHLPPLDPWATVIILHMDATRYRDEGDPLPPALYA